MPDELNKSRIDFHHGAALLRVADHYPTLAEVVYEGTQNALDAEATNISVVINHQKRTITISDDGAGTSREHFELALTSVCKGIKEADRLGQFGMGLIAPLGKCQSFTFTSTPKDNPSAYLQWTFDTEIIRQQEKIDGIAVKALPGLHFEREPKGRGGVPWRTQVKITRFTKDRILSRMSILSLRDGILERFSTAMRRRNVAIEIAFVHPDGETETEKVVADTYTGQRLATEYVSEKDAGQTTFQLYVANKTAKGRRGRVVIGESGKDFTISFSQFARVAGDFIEPEASEALRSGVFEGQIFSARAKLDPNRRHFIANDALVGLCITINQWYHKTGERHMEKAKEEAQDDRYQELGKRSMRVVEGLLEQPEFAHLLEVVKSFRIGNIGVRHARPNGVVLGPQDGRSVSVNGSGYGHNHGDGNGPKQPQRERNGHVPYTVSGVNGRQRTMVKGNSQGLQFSYEEMEGSDRLWELDSDVGILHYNTRHPLWDQSERYGERSLMRFQEHIAITALHLETIPEEWREKLRRMLDDAMPSVVFWLTQGDELAGRGRATMRSATAA